MAAPHRSAVIDETGEMTYAELAAAARETAGRLAAAGVGRGDRVAVVARRTAATVAAIHGILSAGAAYVPLDPEWPRERTHLVIRDCAVSAVLGDDGPAEAMPGPSPEPDSDGADPAYVLYTSGSTGAPKGVVVSRAALWAFIGWAVGEFALRSSDVLAGHAPFSFDISTFDLFASVAVGATLALVPSYLSGFPVDLARFVRRHRITVWYSVPYPLAMLGELGDSAAASLASLRVVLFAGEVFPPEHLAKLMAVTPRAEHANLYGPTETNVCTFWRVTEPPDRPVPIGRPITGNTCHVEVDGRPAREVGAVGELWVTGATVADGYWGDPEATAARFRRTPGGRAYRTGDIVRVVAPGTFEYVGRADHMVKVRGVRIELGEVERAALAVPDVREACAVAVPDPLLGHRIRLLVTPGEADTAEVLAACRARLHPAAVPAAVQAAGSLPRTGNGKVDRLRVRRSVLVEAEE